jgi:hypothetical protein
MTNVEMKKSQQGFTLSWSCNALGKTGTVGSVGTINAKYVPTTCR